jgi:phytoene dehydrogenase-like protein
MSKVTIIGGGVSGLAAGIYAQLSGLESEIFEGHSVIGGQCTSWTRKGFHIDNCVHWMTGTSPKKEIYEVWKDVGVIGDGCEMIKHDYFLQVDIDGVKGHAWRDLNKMEAELLLLAPEDKHVIRSLIKAIRQFQTIELPALKPKEQMSFWDNMKLLWKMKKAIPVAMKYGKMTIGDLAMMFKSPIIRQIIYNYVPETYFAISTLYMYAMFSAGNADLPLGGSDSITLKMRDRYLQLGGKISTKKKASSIVVEGSKCKQVNFEDGTSTDVEYLISATDISVTFKLIGEKYIDSHFKFCYDSPEKFPVFSNVNIYYSIDTPSTDIPTMEIFNCEPYIVAEKECKTIIVNNFADQPGFAPEGKGLIEVLIVQYDHQYDYWESLYNDRDAYRAEKARIAQEVMQRLEKHYPQHKGQFTVLESVTPKSFNRYTGAYKGSYMGFIQTHHVKKETHSGILPGLDNLYLAGQWLQTPGGLPNALVTGRFAVQRLLKRENMLQQFCCKKNK